MSFHLSTLKELIIEDFVIVTSKKEINVNGIAKPLFLKENERFLLLNPENHNWTEVECAESDMCIHHAMDKLKNASFLLVQEQGNLLGYVTSFELFQSIFRSYRELRAFYDTVMDTTDASVTAIDMDENICIWTEGAEKIFSLKKEEVIGKNIQNFFDKDKLVILNALKEGKRLLYKQHQARSDLFVLINSNPVFLDDEIIGAVVSETDITSQIILNQELFNKSSEIQRLQREVEKLQPSKEPFREIKGNSNRIKRTIELAKKVSSVKSTVLILGESGVGKEVFARAIHKAREEPSAPFISINCGAIPESLFESELFGYERGAFSGADTKGKKGKIELAKGGTLFLDEIGEMPLKMQVKLLRVLQEKKFYRIGGLKEIDSDCRILAATNRDLKQLIKEKKFREDLFYRLNVMSIHIPPLRERQEDIIELTHSFLNEFSVLYSRPIQGIPQHIMQSFIKYQWPGNIRELRNVMERLVVFATDGIIKEEDLPFEDDMKPGELKTTALQLEVDLGEVRPLQEEMNEHEKRIIENALKFYDGNKLICAENLGVTRATLYNRMKRLNITY